MLILGFIHKTDSVAKDNTKSYSFLASHPVDSEVGGSRPWAEENQYVEKLWLWCLDTSSVSFCNLFNWNLPQFPHL